jgi:hypothetical protein
VESGDTRLEDADELETMVEIGRYSTAQADAVRAIADQARREQIDPRAWPLDEEWGDVAAAAGVGPATRAAGIRPGRRPESR